MHKSRAAMAAIQEAGFEMIEYPSYSPNLAPNDSYLLLRLKEHRRSHKFKDDDEAVAPLYDFLRHQEYKKGLF